MAEAPTFEPRKTLYRNLWRGSKLSESTEAHGKGSFATWEQTSEGVELTMVQDMDVAGSIIYTNGAYRVPIENLAPYSWSIPVKNTGDLPFPVRVVAWVTKEGGASSSKTTERTLLPGETAVMKLENMFVQDEVVPADHTRWSLYYADTSEKPPGGAKLTIMDGVTLTQSPTAPPTFNGDRLFGSEIPGAETRWIGTPGDSDSELFIRGGTDNLFVDPFFDEGMTHWTNGAQGGGNSTPTQGLAPGYGLPGHTNAFSMGAYVTGTGLAAGPTPWLEDRPQAKQGDVLQGVALVKRTPGGTVSSTAVIELRPWRNPGGVSTVGGSMASVRLADMPVDEWVELSGSWTLTEAGSYDAFARVYYSPYGAWPPNTAPAPSVLIGYQFTTVNPGAPRGGVTEVGIATAAREGITSDIFVRSREKIDVQLARPDEQLIAGERIELAAFAASASDMAWRWRQITGPPVALIREENTATFIAPDVAEPTDLRIACRASSVDGANSSDWQFFDLTIDPPRTRWIPEEGAEFVPRSPQMVGYDRGKREIWNDVTEPVGMDSDGRWDAVLRDLGIPADDVQFVHDGAPPKRAAAGGVYIDIETGEIYRNFGGGYNETENTEGAPRLNAYMVNPATGDVYEWMESEHPRGTWGSAFYRWMDANYDWRGLK